MGEGKIFVIGDIHGCSEMLKRLIDKIDWNPSHDRLIFIGDYIDRGENAKDVVDFILDDKNNIIAWSIKIINWTMLWIWICWKFIR